MDFIIKVFKPNKGSSGYTNAARISFIVGIVLLVFGFLAEPLNIFAAIGALFIFVSAFLLICTGIEKIITNARNKRKDEYDYD